MSITDAQGYPIIIGHMVKILSVPDWLIHDLPVSEAARIRACEGTTMRVIDIDRHGYVWVAADDGQGRWFCLKPENIVGA